MQDQKDPREKFAPEEIQELIKTLDEKKPLSPYQVLIYSYCLCSDTTILKEPSREIFVEPKAVVRSGNVLYQGLVQGLVPKPEDLEILQKPEGWSCLKDLMEDKPEEGNFYKSSINLCISRIKELQYWEGEESRVFDYSEHIKSLENTVAAIKGEPIEVEVIAEA